jgi:hypothetical protein
VTAVLIQLLTSDSIATTVTTRALVSLCVMLELLAISLAVCFAQAHHMQTGGIPPSCFQPLLQHISRVPTVLILTGMVGLGFALVVDTFETSLGTALIMGGFLVFGIGLCVSLLVCGLGELVEARAGVH